MNLIYFLKRLVKEKFSLLFILSRVFLRLKWKIPILKIKISKNSKILLHPASISHGLFLKKYSIESDKKVIEEIVKEDYICFDVGANVGTHTLLMAEKAKNGLIFSIEPSRRIFSCLLDNLRINGYKNVISLNIGISSKNTIRSFYEYQYADDQSAFKINKEWKRKEYKVVSMRLDTLFEILNLSKIDFLKVDVEGEELFVLKSTGHFINKINFIFFEFIEENYKRFGYKGKEVIKFLSSKNFEILKPKIKANKLIFEKFHNLNFKGNLLAKLK